MSRVWRQWNRGSGHESRDFIDAQTRSLSMADLAIVDGMAFFAKGIGWERVDVDLLGAPPVTVHVDDDE